jgi:hypothetical protein
MNKKTDTFVKHIKNKHFVEARSAFESCLEEKIKTRFTTILKSRKK